MSFFFRYKIVDIGNQYQVDLNMSVCYSEAQLCDYNIQLWTDTLMNESNCDLAAGCLDSGWSLIVTIWNLLFSCFLCYPRSRKLQVSFHEFTIHKRRVLSLKATYIKVKVLLFMRYQFSWFLWMNLYMNLNVQWNIRTNDQFKTWKYPFESVTTWILLKIKNKTNIQITIWVMRLM